MSGRRRHRSGWIAAVAIAALWVLHAMPTVAADLTLVPSSVLAPPGSTVAYDVEVVAGATESVDGVQLALDFDATLLQVVSFSATDSFPAVIVPAAFDNEAGTIDYAAGTFTDFPDGTFRIATIQFRVVASGVCALPAPLTWANSEPRVTDLTFAGASVLGAAVDAEAVVGPTCTPSPSATPTPAPATGASLVLVPTFTSVAAGAPFAVAVEVHAHGTQAVDAAQMEIDFDPAQLEVTSIVPGTALPVPLKDPSFDNVGGTLSYAAGAFSSFPTGIFALATVHFERRAGADDCTSSAALDLHAVVPRRSDVSFLGASILADLRGATVGLEPACTPTPTPMRPTASLAGRITYYAGGMDVPGVVVHLHGEATDADVTQADGRFAFPAVPQGNVFLEPSKRGDLGDAISAYDAALVLQHLAGAATLSERQAAACDVDGDAGLSAADVTAILAQRVGLTAAFAAADACMSDFVFFPEAQPIGGAVAHLPRLAPTADGCMSGGVVYQPLRRDAANQDLAAAVLGDCSGNWAASPTPVP